MSRTRIRLATRSTLLLLGLLCAEVALQAVAAVSPTVGSRLSGLKPRYIADPILDVRGDPTLPEYDERGFRNESRPQRASIVAIGDSQTEGSGVTRADAWPQQLSRLLATDVYQLAFGSYGPGHYELLLDEALSLDPEIVVVAVYTGNDLAGMFDWVYGRGRSPELASRDPTVRASVLQAQRDRGPIDGAWRETRDAQKLLYDRPVLRWVRANLEDRLKLVALYNQLRWRLSGRSASLDAGAASVEWESVARAVGKVPHDLLWPLERGAVRTVLTPRARASAQDPSDPRIDEGLRMTLAVLERMAERTRGRSRFLVTLIPTKESVVVAAEHDARRELPPFVSVVFDHEHAVHTRMSRFLDERHIAWVSPLAALVDAMNAVASGRARADAGPYPSDWDGHPSARGHAAIARSVATAINDLSW